MPTADAICAAAAVKPGVTRVDAPLEQIAEECVSIVHPVKWTHLTRKQRARRPNSEIVYLDY